MPPRRQELVDRRLAGGRDVAGGERRPDALEERERRSAGPRRRRPCTRSGRGHDGEQAAGERAEEDGDEGRPAQKRQHEHEQRAAGSAAARDGRPPRSPPCIGRGVEVAGRAEQPEAEDGDRERGHGGPERLAHVVVEVGAGGGAGEVGGVGERRGLVAEVGAGDDRAGGDRGIEAHLLRDAHQADADGAGDGPGAADRHRDHGADQAGGHVEVVGAEQLQPVVDHRDQRAAERPGPDQRADREQDEDRRQAGGDAGDGGVAQLLDRMAVPPGDRRSRRARRTPAPPGSGPPRRRRRRGRTTARAARPAPRPARAPRRGRGARGVVGRATDMARTSVKGDLSPRGRRRWSCPSRRAPPRGTSASAQMIARPPVARAKSCAASTFGPIEPAGKA